MRSDFRRKNSQKNIQKQKSQSFATTKNSLKFGFCETIRAFSCHHLTRTSDLQSRPKMNRQLTLSRQVEVDFGQIWDEILEMEFSVLKTFATSPKQFFPQTTTVYLVAQKNWIKKSIPPWRSIHPKATPMTKNLTKLFKNIGLTRGFH